MQQTKLLRALASIALGSALLASGSSAMAASAVLKLQGNITPPSCTPTFTGGGIIDYGTVALKGGEHTSLPEKKTTLQIACTSPTMVAYKVTDDRNNSASAMSTNFLTFLGQAPGSGGLFAKDQVYGLGKNGTKNIGGYSLRLEGLPTVDGAWFGKVNAYNLTKEIPVIGNILPDAWIYNVISKTFITKGTLYTAGNVLQLGAILGIAPPVAGKNFSFPITIKAELGTASDVGNAADAIKIDGQATFSVVYL
jgi:hypothetical protein